MSLDRARREAALRRSLWQRALHPVSIRVLNPNSLFVSIVTPLHKGEKTMSNDSAVAQSKSHAPKLVLNEHGHKVVHGDNPMGRFNARVAVSITKAVGSMWCAYAF